MQFAGDTVLLAPYSETGAADRIMLVDYDKFQCFDKKSWMKLSLEGNRGVQSEGNLAERLLSAVVNASDSFVHLLSLSV